METKPSSSLPTSRFVRVPAAYIQAGYPLKLTLYGHVLGSTSVQLLHRKGESLGLPEFLKIIQASGVRILVAEQELNDLIAQPDSQPIEDDMQNSAAA